MLAVALAVATTLVACGEKEEPPADGPPPEAVTQLGFNEGIDPAEEGLDVLADSGASLIRTPLTWSRVEPVEGARDWSRYDQIYDELLAAGVQPVWAVLSAPCWAAATPDCSREAGSHAPAPENFGKFADFVAELAERYPETAAIEVWNEPNLERFFIGSGGPAFYAELFSATSEALSAAESGAALLVAAPSPVIQRSPGKLPWRPYLTAVLEAIPPGSTDGVALHPYSFFVPEGEPLEVGRRMLAQAEAIIAASTPDQLPIWITEIGVSTTGPSAAGPAEQAELLVALYELFADAGTQAVIVHRLFDERDPEFAIEGGYGVVEADRSTPKPSYRALADARAARG